MTTAAEQYRALVNRLESITEAPEDPRSPEERDSQMANVKNAFKDYEDAEEKKQADAMKDYASKLTGSAAQTAQPASSDVKKIQTLLNTKGANLTVDGRLGPQTIKAVLQALEANAPAQAAQPAQEPAPAAGVHQPFTVGQKSAGPTDAWSKGGLFNR